MSFFQRVVPELSADLRAFANLDCESPFTRLYNMTEMPTQLGTPTGGSYPSPHTDVMTRASNHTSRRQTAGPIEELHLGAKKTEKAQHWPARIAILGPKHH
jgi:hypothetical protein